MFLTIVRSITFKGRTDNEKNLSFLLSKPAVLDISNFLAFYLLFSGCGFRANGYTWRILWAENIHFLVGVRETLVAVVRWRIAYRQGSLQKMKDKVCQNSFGSLNLFANLWNILGKAIHKWDEFIILQRKSRNICFTSCISALLDEVSTKKSNNTM